MGLMISKADGEATAPPPLPNFSFASQAAAVADTIKKTAAVDYLNLPQVRLGGGQGHAYMHGCLQL